MKTRYLGLCIGITVCGCASIELVERVNVVELSDGQMDCAQIKAEFERLKPLTKRTDTSSGSGATQLAGQAGMSALRYIPQVAKAAPFVGPVMSLIGQSGYGAQLDAHQNSAAAMGRSQRMLMLSEQKDCR